MYSLIKYLLPNSKKESELTQNKVSEKVSEIPLPPQSPKRQIVKNCTRNCKRKIVYLVIEKGTQNPLGVFDDLEQAKQNGQRITYYNCVIIPFQINDPCKYLFKPTFENK